MTFSRTAYLEQKVAAERKKALAEAVPVELPSGAIFNLRRLDMNAYVLAGRVPESLLASGLAAWKGQNVGGMPANFDSGITSAEDTLRALVFMRDAVRDACVLPRIVSTNPTDEEITPAELSKDDFNFIFQYAVGAKGGDADALKTFRGERAADAGDSENG